MRIKKLELKGFKSFPYKTEILLSPRITIVAGPNGCGKTNIFEAILFALGEKKVENLRGKVWQDLIFSGSEKVARSGMAEVAIVLEEKGEEFEIRRKIYRDGKIENYINGEYVSHIKWNEKIYEIFPQGKGYALFRNEDIERIIIDAPKVLRELIHSAAGIELFERKKETLKRRLSRIEREIERIEDIMFEKEKRLKDLEKEVQRLKTYWEIKKRISFLERKKLSINYYYVKRELVRKEKEREGKLKEMEIFTEREKEYLRELEEIKEEIKKLEEALVGCGRREEEILDKEREVITEKARLLERKENVELRMEDLRKRKRSLEEVLEEIKSEIRKFNLKDLELDEDKLREEESNLQALEKEISGLEIEMSNLKMRKVNLEEVLRKKEEEVLKNREILEEEKLKRKKVLDEMGKIKEREKNLMDEREKFLVNLHPLDKKIEELEEKIEKARVSFKTLESRIKYLEGQRGEEKDKFFFEFLDLNDKKTVIFENLFYYPVLKIDEIISHQFDKPKFLIEEKISDFISSQFSKILYTGKLKDLLKEISSLDDDKIYITEDGYILESGFIVEKLKRERIKREREIKELKERISQEKEKLDSLLEEFKEGKKEREDIINRLNKIEDLLLEIKKELKIKETELELTLLSIRDLEKRISEGEREIGELNKEIGIIKEKVQEVQLFFESKRAEKEKVYKEYIHMEKVFKEKERLKYLERTEQETEKELMGVEEKLMEMREEVERLNKKIEEVLREEERIFAIKRETDEEKKKLLQEKEELEERKEALLVKIDENRKNLQKVKEDIVAIQVKIESVKEKLTEFPDDIEESYPDTGMRKIEEEIEKLKRRLFEFEDVNLAAEKEYEKEREEYENMVGTVNDVKSSREKMRSAMDILEEEAKRRFFEIYENFKSNIKEVAKSLLKGDIHIELENPNDPLNSEFLMKARPFGKKVRAIPLLSGGERSLLALSIIFALHKVAPVPFCILDEVDAALDDANTLRFVEFIKALSHDTQLFIITHNKRTMESGDILYGISMEDGVSKIFSLRLEEVR